MNINRTYIALGIATIACVFMAACHAKAPASKTSSTQDLLAQVEAIEADEAILLFQKAKAAAEKDNIKEAKSLVQQALGRGAGANGMAEAEAEIKKAETRIAEKKRKAAAARVAAASSSSSYSGSNSGSSAGGKDVSFITVKVNPGSGMSENDLKLTLSRQYGRFSDNNGRSNEVQIYQPDIGSIAGQYSWHFSTIYQQSAFHKKQYKSCKGSFTVNGRKSFVMLHISSDCSGYAQ